MIAEHHGEEDGSRYCFDTPRGLCPPCSTSSGPLQDRFVPAQYRWSRADLKPVAKAGTGDVRLLIAPANFASQAVFWARAAELLPGVSARVWRLDMLPQEWRHVLMCRLIRGWGRSSHIWARRQRKQILRDFTHVLYEAESTPFLVDSMAEDLEAEIRDLQAHGVRVGFHFARERHPHPFCPCGPGAILTFQQSPGRPHRCA